MKYKAYFKKIDWQYFCLAVIILIAIIFRFYNIPNRYGFDFDATRDGLISLYGARHLILPMLGPASALGFFHFGPLYYYLLIIFERIVPLLYAPWMLNGVLSVLTVGVAYKLGEDLIDKKFGLIMALLVAVSPAQIIASTGLSNPDFVVLPAFLSIWIFIKIIKHKIAWWWFLIWGVVLGWGMNNHFQMLTYLVFLPIGLWFSKQRLQYLIFVSVGLIISFLPFAIFDSTQGWVNVRGFWNYLVQGQNSVYIPNSWKIYTLQFWPQFWSYVLGIPQIAGIILAVGVGVSFLVGLYKKKVARELLILIGAFFIMFLYLRYHAGSKETYYLFFLHPFIFLCASYFLWFIIQIRYGVIVCLAILAVYGVIIIPRDSLEFHTFDSHTEDVVLTGAIIQKAHTDSIQYYECNDRTQYRIQALALLTDYKNDSLPKKKMIGVIDEDCPVGIKKNGISYKELDIQNIHAQYKNLSDIHVLEFQNESNSDLQKKGWIKVSIESVYSDTMNKWLK